MKQRRYKRDPDAMWAVIRKLKRFTRKDIMRAMHIDRDSQTIRPFLGQLIAGGYVAIVKQQKGATGGDEAIVYELVRDAGKYRPRLDSSGKPLPPTERQRMWAALKVIGGKPFDWRDLSLVAGCTDTREYIRYLEHAGYLRNARKGNAHQTALYVFVRARDSGPIAPEIRKKRSEVYDPNTGKVVWQKGGAA